MTSRSAERTVRRRGRPAAPRAPKRVNVVRGVSVLDVAVFVGIMLLGLAHLPTPFHGDQAINMLMGKVVASGGSPYVDVWDLKHPGIFFFFGAAGSLFGFTEIAIHLFELLWMLALALVVRMTAKHLLRSQIAISLAPALTVGFYYAVATKQQLTQTEGIVGLPLLLALASVSAAIRPGSRYPRLLLFLSGLSAGIVFVFKAPYAALPVLFWVLAYVEWRRTRETATTPGALAVVPLLLGGVLLPVGACVLYLANKDALDLAWWTFTVHPLEVARETRLGLRRLTESWLWFVLTFRFLLALAIIGAADRLRSGWDLLTASLSAWVLGGLVLIWTQVIGWWTYHYMLIFVPLGLLAALGAEAVWRALTTSAARTYRRVIVAAALLVLILVSVSRIAPGVQLLADVVRARPLPFTTDHGRAFQAAQDAEYADAIAITSFLRTPERQPGPIYVFGSPLFYVLADRSPAIAPLATWFHPTSEAWRWMRDDLVAASPAYILIADGAMEFFTYENPALKEEVRALDVWLHEHYETLPTAAGGTWLVRRDRNDPGLN